MIIRTISLLPKVQSSDGIPDSSLIEMSISKDQSTGRFYISKACEYSVLKTLLFQHIDLTINSTYNMKSGNTPINVKSLYDTVNSLKSGSLTLAGNKTFSGLVTLNNSNNYTYSSDTNKQKYAATMKCITDAINGKSTRINASSAVCKVQFLFNLQTSRNIAKFGYVNASGALINTDNLQVPYTGTLVAYGWLADTGTIDTAHCWVALEGKVNNTWQILQLQPWILGSRHEYLQYVGFTMPVAAGIQLRIRTGFDIDYSSSSYLLRDGTLVNNMNVPLQTNLGPAFVGAIYY